jgi:hypothetical protein
MKKDLCLRKELVAGAKRAKRGAPKRDWRVAYSLNILLAEINKWSPIRSKEDDGSIGDAAHSSRTSDHNPNREGVVCARDFTHDPKNGFNCHEFVDFLCKRLKNGEENRVKYLIFDRTIYSGPAQGHAVGVGRKYTGTNPHTAHCHVSVRGVKELYDSREGWGWTGVSDYERAKKERKNILFFEI